MNNVLRHYFLKLSCLSLLLLAANSSLAHESELSERVTEIEARLQSLQFSNCKLPNAFVFTDNAYFLSDSTSRDKDIKRRLEREFYVIVNDRASVALWQFRAQDYFPFIEQELKKRNMPDDLKFLAIAESGLVTTAKSWAGAAGTWQFMKATGARYGLQAGSIVDDRLNFERATHSALNHLRDLYKRFGDWQLAMAAYNCGETCVANALSSQGVISFWDLVLPLETERYVPRIIAISYVMTHLGQCNLDLRLQPSAAQSIAAHDSGAQKAAGAEHAVRASGLVSAVVSIRRAVSLIELSRLAGTTYRQLKIDNPQIVARVLPAGTYSVYVDKNKLKQLRLSLDNINEIENKRK